MQNIEASLICARKRQNISNTEMKCIYEFITMVISTNDDDAQIGGIDLKISNQLWLNESCLVERILTISLVFHSAAWFQILLCPSRLLYNTHSLWIQLFYLLVLLFWLNSVHTTIYYAVDTMALASAMMRRTEDESMYVWMNVMGCKRTPNVCVSMYAAPHNRNEWPVCGYC